MAERESDRPDRSDRPGGGPDRPRDAEGPGKPTPPKTDPPKAPPAPPAKG